MRIYFEDEEFDITSFISLCRTNSVIQESEDWRQSIFHFFNEWYNSDEAITVKTSGSTGEAKSISIQKKHVINSARATLQYLNLPSAGLAWLCLSAKYIAGKMMIIRALTGDLDLYISEPAAIPVVPADRKITLTALVPSQLSQMLTITNGLDLLEKSVEHILIGGGPIPQDLENRVSHLKEVNIWHTYGMTETISHIALRKVNGQHAATFFTPFPEVSVSRNKQGCLTIDYPAIGVRNLHTNDLVTLSEDGTFSVDGRKDFIINSGGIKLNPMEIERKLEDKLPCPFFITGVPDTILGEKAVLCIENNRELLPNICDFWKIIENEVSKHEIPREIRFMDYFIRSENGKLKRQATSLLLDRQFE